MSNATWLCGIDMNHINPKETSHYVMNQQHIMQPNLNNDLVYWCIKASLSNTLLYLNITLNWETARYYASQLWPSLLMHNNITQLRIVNWGPTLLSSASLPVRVPVHLQHHNHQSITLGCASQIFGLKVTGAWPSIRESVHIKAPCSLHATMGSVMRK